MASDLPTGTTIRLLLIQCSCPPERLTAHQAIASLVREAILACDMVPLSMAGHDFTGAGHSLCWILAESHIAVHTYPECSRSAMVELSVCDHLRANSDRAHRLAQRLVDMFQPERYVLEPSQFPVGPAVSNDRDGRAFGS